MSAPRKARRPQVRRKVNGVVGRCRRCGASRPVPKKAWNKTVRCLECGGVMDRTDPPLAVADRRG